jgi:dipeptidyl-peptidase-4
MQDLASGAVTRLTSTGSETVINGTTDWVTEEELRLREAYRWSPDGRSIAYWSFDTSGVGVYTLIDDTDSLYPEVKRYPYPKVGTKNSAVRVGVVPAAGGTTRWIDLPGDPREHYVARMEWCKDASAALVIERLNRLQNTAELFLADSASGQARSIYRDESKTWVDVTPEIRSVDGGRAFLVESDRDGWRHVWRAPRDGGSPTLVTRFEGDVEGVTGVDEKGGWLYFLASPDRPTERHLYRCRLDGGAKSGATSRVAIERVGPERPGSETWDLSPDRHWAFHGRSRFDDPPVYDVVRLPAFAVVRTLLDNAELKKAVEEKKFSPVEFFRLPVGDGVTLDGWMLKPPGFDPSKKYPLVVFIYGEPASATVVDRWSGATGLFHRALAARGFLIASFDNRGTPAPRGTAWRHAAYGAVGEVSAKDQAAAVRALAAERPYVDSSRVGIWGWSGGGSNTLNAMFRFPEVYKVGVSVAPVPDQRLYDTIYQERYMGLPETNEDGYRRGSPISFAEGLKGKLLVVHGSGDDNVHYQGTEKLVNRLVELGKPFDLMVYPGRTHAIAEGKGTSAHVHSLIARYFLENL